MKNFILICICGRVNKMTAIGNKNADAKTKCKCGRNLTVHFRKHIEKKRYN